MNIAQHPFVLAALEDVVGHRVRTVTAHELTVALSDNPAPVVGYRPDDEHLVTDTFHSLWSSLSTIAVPEPGKVLAVMRGVQKNPKHPAYRVTHTSEPNICTAKAGDHITLTLQTIPEPTGEGQFRDEVTWLAVVHT